MDLDIDVLDQHTSDPVDPARELTFFLMPAQAIGRWFSAFAAGTFLCDAPRVIELDEIARPFWSIQEFVFDAAADPEVEEFEPPLIAAGSFQTFARHGSLPPLQWDD